MSYNGPPPYASDGCYYPPPPQAVIICQEIGNCPSCHRGNLSTNITCLGVCCAIFLFPIGLICLLLLTEERCSTCGYSV